MHVCSMYLNWHGLQFPHTVSPHHSKQHPASSVILTHYLSILFTFSYQYSVVVFFFFFSALFLEMLHTICETSYGGVPHTANPLYWNTGCEQHLREILTFSVVWQILPAHPSIYHLHCQQSEGKNAIKWRFTAAFQIHSEHPVTSILLLYILH